MLDDRGFQVIVAVAARVITVPDADPAVLAERIDESLSRLPPEARADLASLVGLFENALPGLLLDGRATPFTCLDGPAQDRALASWRDSRLVVRRSGYHALRRLCFAAYTWSMARCPRPASGSTCRSRSTASPRLMATRLAPR